MTLRRNTMLTISITLLSLFLVLYFALSRVLLSSFDLLEQQEITEQIVRARNVLQDELTDLNQTANDWAGWDESYQFVQDGNRDYYENFGDAGLAAIKINLLAYLKPSGTLVYGTTFDTAKAQKTPLPPDFRQFLQSAAGKELLHLDEKSSVTGLLMLRSGPLLLAARPILTNEKKGPARGILLFGRNLDIATLKRLSNSLTVPLAISRLDQTQPTPDFAIARQQLSLRQPLYIHPLSANSVAAYYLLSDIGGRPAIILRAETARDIYQQGLQSLHYLIWALIVSGSVFACVTMLLVENSVLRRLHQLGSRVNQIRTAGNITERIKVDGKDELSHLMQDINAMLEALEQGQTQLRKNENLYRQMAMNASDALYSFPIPASLSVPATDISSHNSSANTTPIIQWYGPIDEMLGYAAGEWEHNLAAWEEALHPEDRARVVAARNTACRGGKPFHQEYRIRSRNGTYRNWAERGQCIEEDAQEPRRLIGACTDITERVQAEQVLRASEEQEKHIALLMRGVLSAADELLSCHSVDEVLRRGLELAREKLDIERCSIALRGLEDKYLIGTYGTNLQGQTTDEHAYRFETPDWLLSHPQLSQRGRSGWAYFEKQALYEWDGQETRFIGEGWLCATLIQGPDGLVGILFNDTAISGSGVDSIQQEILAIYCSLLGNIIEHKQIETQLQQVISGARCLLWQAHVIEQNGSYQWETHILNGDTAQEFLPVSLPDGSTYSTGFYGAILPEEYPRLKAVSTQALSSGQETYKQEFRIRLLNGEIRWLTEEVRIEPQGSGRWLLTGVCTDATDHKQLQETRQAVLKRLVKAQEEERQRISRELHDRMGQDLAALLLRLKSIPAQEQLPPQIAEHLQELEKLTRHLMQQSRRLALDLRPETLDKLGLSTALRRFTQEWSQHSGVPVDFHSQNFDECRLPSDMETTIYRVAQEALSNILRHAGARQVSVLLERHPQQVVLLIEDDGRGFDVKNALNLPLPQRRLGLMGMYERVALVHGMLKVESHPGQGTTIVARIPIPQSLESEHTQYHE
jgi:PAS domain S-box-containing protein